MLSMFDVILERTCELEVFEDNEATIKIVRKGYSAKLRHVSRTHRVNLAGLSEELNKESVNLQYVNTTEQAADIFTKALEPHKWDAALRMISIVKEVPCSTKSKTSGASKAGAPV